MEGNCKLGTETENKVIEVIKNKGLIFDGGMGSMLIKAGLEGGESPEAWNLTRPDIIQGVHKAYFEAGADVATTNTFGASALKLEQIRVTRTMEEINLAGVELARAACSPGQFVAGGMGSIGEMLPPMGSLTEENAIKAFADQAEVLDRAGVDFLIVETIFDLNLALAALKGIRSVSEKPVFCTLTFKQMKKGFFTLMGNGVADSMSALVDAGACVMGANCSMGSDTMVELAKEIRQSTDAPVMIQPNAGLPQTREDQSVFYPEDEEFFADNIKKIKNLGIEIVGGCCGTTPEYIRRVKETL